MDLDWDDESDFEKYGQGRERTSLKISFPEAVEHKQLVPYVFCTKEQMTDVECLREVLALKIPSSQAFFEFVMGELKKGKKKGTKAGVVRCLFLVLVLLWLVCCLNGWVEFCKLYIYVLIY